MDQYNDISHPSLRTLLSSQAGGGDAMGLKPSCLKGKVERGVWDQGEWGSKKREAGVEIVQGTHRPGVLA